MQKAGLYLSVALAGALLITTPLQAQNANPTGISIRAENGTRLIETPRYKATVRADGALSNLQINGQEFLRPNFLASRGSYFVQGTVLSLPNIEQTGDSITAQNDKASIRYQFGPDKMTWTLTNKTAEAMSFVIVFDAAVDKGAGPDGATAPTLLGRNWPISTWFAGASKLKISGGDKQWPWRDAAQVWEAALAPNETRQITLEPSTEVGAPPAKAAAPQAAPLTPVAAVAPVVPVLTPAAAPAPATPVTTMLPPVNRPVTDANLIKNGDFELESPQSPPPGWLMWGSTGKDPKNYTRDTTQAHTGKASFRIFHPANTGGYTISSLTDFRPQKGMTYDISFWAKTDVPGPSGFGMFSIISADPLVPGPPLAGKTLVLDTNWKKFSFPIVEGTDFSIDTANYLTLNFNATPQGVNSQEKTIWVDDVVVTEKRVGPPLNSGISLSPLFGEGMVVQRQMPVPLWGTGKVGQKITATLNGKSASAVADANGKWLLKLPALGAGGPYNLKFQAGTPDEFAVKNVYVGDVWVASGQSNMEYPLAGWASADTPSGKKALEAVMSANDPQLHFFTVTRNSTDTVQTDLKGRWQETSPENAGAFSAVAYYFARDLRRELKIPIGIIHSSWGGSSAQGWTRRDLLENDPDLRPGTIGEFEGSLKAYPKAKADYDAQLVTWQADVDKAKAAGTTAPAKPREPIGPTFFTRPSALYNGMIAPLLPYGIKGVIWYQGESNAGGNGPRVYRKLFPTMISNWRKDWGQGDFPFLFVQLANFQKEQTEPVETRSWAEIREAQAMTLSVPNTGMATAIDLADADNPSDIHPKNKWDVGKRLSLVALAQVYGQPIISSGPTYDSMKIEGNTIRLKFKNAAGLKAKGDILKGFAIAGADKNFVWADAKIEGDSVVVSSPQVAAPIAVRYDWASNPIGNLYNGADLPASTFRTDPSL